MFKIQNERSMFDYEIQREEMKFLLELREIQKRKRQ
jgi:hypothetical protein